MRTKVARDKFCGNLRGYFGIEISIRPDAYARELPHVKNAQIPEVARPITVPKKRVGRTKRRGGLASR
jgi:hypothetical protein